MKPLTLLFVFCLSVASAQTTWSPLPDEPNGIVGQYRSAAPEKATSPSTSPNPALVQAQDQIFPHLATGGGWETILVLVNMGTTSVTFTQKFYDQSGAPMRVTFRSVPEAVLTTTSTAQGTLRPGGSFNIVLFDAGTPLQVGWSGISYDATGGRIGGYAIFRSRQSGRTDFEALVPLSPYDETRFYFPFDNLEGFVTSMAILNPASNLSNRVTMTFLDTRGEVLFSDTIVLAPSSQVAFGLPLRYPALAGRIGAVYVQSDITRLSALGFRFNPQGAFATIPILSWSGL